MKELRGSGLSPDLIVCRSEMPIIDEVKQKISNFCHVKPDRVCIDVADTVIKDQTHLHF